MTQVVKAVERRLQPKKIKNEKLISDLRNHSVLSSVIARGEPRPGARRDQNPGELSDLCQISP